MAAQGTASTTRSAPSTAARLDSAARAPVASAAALAESPFAELTVTLCPALRADPVSALPTFPAPMIAMFMVVLRTDCFRNSFVQDYFI